MTVFLGSCDNKKMSHNYMAFDNIRYATNFPFSFSLNKAVEIDLEREVDIIGAMHFIIQDSLLIFSTKDKNGFWSFVSLPDYHFLGKFLVQGQGPYEFLQSPSTSSKTRFFRENEELFATIYHRSGKLYKMNVSESLKANRLNIAPLNEYLSPGLLDFVFIDCTTFLCRELNGTETQQIRYILKNNEKIIPSHIERLNFAKIRENGSFNDFNILAANTKYNTERKLFVEAPVFLNYINMYSINDAFRKTICIGGKMDNIEEIQDIPFFDRLYTFVGLRLFPEFWGVLHINESVKNYQTNKECCPKILLFDWSGNPLAQLELTNFATSFDIDFVNGYLYTLELETEAFFKYDIRDILQKLKTKN